VEQVYYTDQVDKVDKVEKVEQVDKMDKKVLVDHKCVVDLGDHFDPF